MTIADEIDRILEAVQLMLLNSDVGEMSDYGGGYSDGIGKADRRIDEARAAIRKILEPK